MTSPITAKPIFPMREELGAVERRRKSFFPDIQRLVDLGLAEDERREHADAVRVDPRLEQQQALAGGPLGDRARELRCRLFALPVADELDREHHPEPADVTDRVEPLLPGLHSRADRVAE